MTTARTKTPNVVLEIDRILQILPYRFPFVLVDRVSEVTPFKSIKGHKCVAMNEPWFLGHYPHRPMMPGVLVLESLAQIGALLVYASEPFDAQSMLYFLGIDKAKFRRPVIPGDRLDLEVSLEQQRTNVWKLRGEAFVDGALCAQAELVASVVERHG